MGGDSAVSVCGGVDPRTVNIVTTALYALITIGLVAYLHYFRRNLIFPVYTKFLAAGGFLFSLRGAIICWAVVRDTDALPMTIFSVTFVHPVGAVISEGLTFFLCLGDGGAAALRKTRLFSVCWFLFYAVLGAVSSAVDASAGTVQNFVPLGFETYWIVIDATRMIFYAAAIAYAARHNPARSSVFVYAAFEFVVYTLSLVGDAMLEERDGAPACLIFVTWAGWTVLWPWVTLYALSLDARYWGGSLERLQKKAYMSSNTVVHNSASSGYSGRGGGDGGDGGDGEDERKRAAAATPLLAGDSLETEGKVIPFSALQFKEVIGAGGTAEVYRGSLTAEDGSTREVAIKKIKVEVLTALSVRHFAQELSFATRFRHPNLLESFGVAVVVPDICLVTELMARGSLFQLLAHEKRLSRRRRLRLGVDACKGLVHLHAQSPPVLHRDLKSLNLLVSEDYALKIADFGEARHLDAHMTKERGTPHWMAPECFLSSSYTEKADVYSLGIVLWELGSGQPPWAVLSPWLIPARVCEKGERPPIDERMVERMGEPFWVLVRRCWAQAPDDRPTAAEALFELMALVK